MPPPRKILCCIFAVLVVHSASGVDVASPAKRDQPIVITHDAGEVIQAIFGVYADNRVEWSTLPDVHFARGETQTIMVAPPGDYVIVTGEPSTERPVVRQAAITVPAFFTIRSRPDCAAISGPPWLISHDISRETS